MPNSILFIAASLSLFIPLAPVDPTPRAAPADKPLQVNDVVYVHASSSLTLRKTPSKEGLKIASVPANGTPLTVVALPEPGSAYIAETIGTFAVKGGWVVVKTQAGQEGYLFDGYLSRYKPLQREKMDGSVSLMDAFYRTISPVKGKRTSLPATNGTIERYQYFYADGARFEEQYYEGGATQILELPKDKFTMQEVLVLFRTAWFGKEKTKGSYDAAKQQLTIDGDGGYSQVIIQPKGNRWMLKFSTAD